MARKRRRNDFQAGELNLTAMIDVAFQLLNFFVITATPVDVFTNLEILRPQPDDRPPIPKDLAAIRITVFPGGYTVSGRIMELPQLRAMLDRLAASDKGQTILIECTNEAQHNRLVELLDACGQSGMTNLSVVSSGGY